MTTGWVFTKGNVGDRLAENTTIYSNVSCLTTIYVGKDTNFRLQERLNMDAGQALTKYSDLISASEEAKQKVKNEELSDWDKVQRALQAWKDAIRENNDIKFQRDLTKIKFYSGVITNDGDSFYSTIKEDNGTTTVIDHAIIDSLDESISSQQQKINELAAIKDKAQEEYEAKWGKNKEGITSSKSVQSPSPIVQEQEKLERELQQLENELKNATTTLSTSQSITAWFDAMEEYIDSLSQISESTSVLYEVESRDGWWFYTGNSAVPDPKLNENIRNWKKKQCERLNNIVQDVTLKAEEELNRLAKRCNKIIPLTTAIQTIKKGLSLDTLVSWGKAAISFFTSIYQFFYDIYKTVMTVMEVLVVRIPQLANKIIAKLMECDCDIQVPPIQVKVSDPEPNKKN